jgi:hypothetical protein
VVGRGSLGAAPAFHGGRRPLPRCRSGFPARKWGLLRGRVAFPMWPGDEASTRDGLTTLGGQSGPEAESTDQHGDDDRLRSRSHFHARGDGRVHFDPEFLVALEKAQEEAAAPTAWRLAGGGWQVPGTCSRDLLTTGKLSRARPGTW